MKMLRSWTWRIVISFCAFGTCLAEAGSQPGTVVAWGTCWNGSSYVPAASPAGLTNAVAIAGGDGHSLALTSGRTLVAWGSNIYGQTNVPPGLSNVVAIAAGGDHSVALQSNGTVVAWGYNYYGQTNVPPGLSNVKVVAAGWGHSLVVRSNGTVVAWGYNNSGQTNVPSGLSGVVSVAGGQYHSLALRSNGTVVAWGDNYSGQTNVPPGLSNVASIVAGAYYNLALRSNGTVVAWGNCYNGEAYVPMSNSIPAGLNDVVAIAGGAHHSLALRSDRRVSAWGTYFNGSHYVSMSDSVPAGLSNVVAIAGGYYHSMAIVVGPEPITLWPPAVSLALQASTNLTVAVSSNSPFGCQWSFNGVPITGATHTSFIITNFALSNAGIYSVVVTNQYGSVSAASAVRLLNSPVVLVDGVDVGGGTVTRIDSSVEVTMSSAFGPDAEIYYTLDGSEPWFGDMPYLGPFTLTNSALIRAIAFDSDGLDAAEAALIYVQIKPTYPLSLSTPGGGSVSNYPAPYTNGNRYVTDTPVTLTATPSDGWSFIQWTGDSTETNSVTTVLMDRPRSVQATFGTALNLFTNGHGQVFAPPTAPYSYGSSVQLLALPNSDSYFYGWYGAASGFDNPLSIQVTDTAPITAVFVLLSADQVSLTVSNAGNGTVTINSYKNVYTKGETVTLTASPGSSNVFTHWSGDTLGSVTTNPLILRLTNSQVVTAHFAPEAETRRPLITQAPPSPISLALGGATNLSVVVSSSRPFGCQWWFNDVPIAGATGTNLVITNFALTNAGVYSVVVTNQYGSVSAASVVRLLNSPVVLVDGVDVGGGTVTRIDSSVEVTISSAFGPDAGIYYTLDGSEPWFGKTRYLGPFTLTNSALIRAIAFDASYEYWAEAAPIEVQILPTYPLSVSTPGGGSVSKYPDPYTNGNRYVSGTNVTLTARTNNGWSFMWWIVNGSTNTANPTTVLMDRSNSVQAVFGTSLSLSTNGSGQVILNRPTGPYPYDSSVQLTALPNSGWYFFGWAGAASGFNNPLSVQVTNTSGITALFAPLNTNQVSLTVSNAGIGTVTINPYKNVYTNGETLTLTASPDLGNVFTHWSGDTLGSVTTNPLILRLTNSQVVTAHFVPGTNSPVIAQQPLSRTLGAGASTLLSFLPTGEEPFSYQWQFNSSPIPGATHSTLTLTNFTATNAGLYSVIVANSAGATTSSNASVALFGLASARFGSLTFPLLILDGAVGTSYRIEYSERLAPTNWILLDTVTLEENEGFWVDDPVANHSHRFYRAVPQ